MPRPRHIPDAARPGYTYCGRFWTGNNTFAPLSIIDLRTDDIESAECKACQRSDDRRQTADHKQEERTLEKERRAIARGETR